MGIIISTANTPLLQVDPGLNRVIETWTLSTTYLNTQPKIASDSRYLWFSTRSGAGNLEQYEHGALTKAPSQISNRSMGHTATGIWRGGRNLYSITTTGVLRQVEIGRGIVKVGTAPGSSYRGLTSDGRFLYTINTTSGNVEKWGFDFQFIEALWAAPSNAHDLEYDGYALWFITGSGSGVRLTLRRYDFNAGLETVSNTLTGTFDSSGDAAGGITFDKRYFWIIYRNQIDTMSP